MICSVRVIRGSSIRDHKLAFTHCPFYQDLIPVVPTVAHNQLCHGTTYFLTAQLTFSWHNLLSSQHNLLSHGTTYFLHCTIYFLTAQLTFFTAQFTFSRHNLLFRGTIHFLTAKITFLFQPLLFYWSRHNLLSHGGSQLKVKEICS